MFGKNIKILIIDQLHPSFFEQVGLADFNMVYLPNIKAKDVEIELANADVLIVRSKVFVDELLCKNAKQLKLVARAGSGVDNLDTEWLSKKGIHFINSAEANSQAVAEQTLGMLLSLMSHISKADAEVRNHIWDREANRGDELDGKTIGIIGFGNTGSRFAKLLSGFEVKILAYDKYKSGFGNSMVIETDMEEIFNKADILSLHIPLTSETENLVNQKFINQFSKPFRLLNLSRGAIANLVDVVEALTQKKLIGFAADVLQNERINQLNNFELTLFNQLTSLTNVVLTPHIGGWTFQSYERISKNLATKIIHYFENQHTTVHLKAPNVIEDST